MKVSTTMSDLNDLLKKARSLSTGNHERKHKLIVDLWMLIMNTSNFTLYSISFTLESSHYLQNIFYTKTFPNWTGYSFLIHLFLFGWL